MSPTRFPKPHQPNKDVREEFEPGAPPVEPDEGPISPLVPDEPEYPRREPGPAGSPQMTKNPETGGPVGRQQPPSPLGAKAPLSAPGLPLPHERDESPEATDATPKTPDPMIAQAKRDIDAGLVDTDMHATPGLDADLRERMVPGPGGKRPPSGR